MKNKVIWYLVFCFVVILFCSIIADEVELNNIHPDHKHTSEHISKDIINDTYDIEYIIKYGIPYGHIIENTKNTIWTWAKTHISNLIVALVSGHQPSTSPPQYPILKKTLDDKMRLHKVTTIGGLIMEMLRNKTQTKEGKLKQINITVDSTKKQLKTFDWCFNYTLSTLKKRDNVDGMYKKLREKDQPPETFFMAVKPLLKVCNQLKREMLLMNSYINNYEKLQQIKEKYGVNDTVMNLTIFQNISAMKKQLSTVFDKINKVQNKVIDYGNAYNLSSSNMTYLINEINGFDSSKYNCTKVDHVEDHLKSCGLKPINNTESLYNKTI